MRPRKKSKSACGLLSPIASVPSVGAVSPMMREGLPPMWLCYFGVREVGPALEAAKAHGGIVTNGPHEVPGGQHVFVCTDPAGATVAFVGPKGE